MRSANLAKRLGDLKNYRYIFSTPPSRSQTFLGAWPKKDSCLAGGLNQLLPSSRTNVSHPEDIAPRISTILFLRRWNCNEDWKVILRHG